jgi:hypothetical protein
MSLWWLSFADRERPSGAQNLGACLVDADSYFEAIREAHRKGCNPGGEVLALEIGRDLEKTARAFPMNQLMSRSEIDAIDHGLRWKPRAP